MNIVPPSLPRRRRSLAVYGDAADIRTWSNIPYFFFNAAVRQSFLTDALNLTDPDYDANRKRWRAGMMMRLQKPVGYQWSVAAGQRMWDTVPAELRGGEFISHFQAFPPMKSAQRDGATFSFYIDTTLSQLIQDPPRKLARHERQVLERERDLYHAARFVIAMARETQRVLIEDYGVNAQKVFTVRPGANLHENTVNDYLTTRSIPEWRSGAPFTREQPAVLGIIANHYVRKGLPKLVKIAEALHARGRPVKVRAVGNISDELKQHPLVDYAGFIQKSDEAKFLEVLGGFAMGCLLSTAEPLGIGTLEALRLGIPVLGHRVGGIPDCVPADAGLLVDVESSPESVADQLEPLLFDHSRYAQLCAAARKHSDEVTWDRAVEKMSRIWLGQG